MGGIIIGVSFKQKGVMIAPMPQNMSHFNEPIKDLRRALKDGLVTHTGDPLLRWCMGNAISRTNYKEEEMLSKRDSSEKIDPAVSLLMGFRRACVARRRPQGSLFIV